MERKADIYRWVLNTIKIMSLKKNFHQKWKLFLNMLTETFQGSSRLGVGRAAAPTLRIIIKNSLQKEAGSFWNFPN